MAVTWDNQKRQFLETFCKEYSDRELVELFRIRFGETVKPSVIHGARLRFGIKTGRSGRFEKGLKPWNRGLHYQAGGRCKQTQFKPGSRPQTWVEIGTETVDPDGYLKRKVRDDAPANMSRKNWEFVHAMKWEAYHGRPVPPKHIVRMKDGGKRNFSRDNLVLVSMAENAILNRFFAMKHPPEGGFEVLLNLARIKLAVGKRKKELAA